MPGIEWQESKEYGPEQLSLREFCQANGITPPGLDSPGGLIVLVEQQALEGLHEYLASDTLREHGGVLVGQPYLDPETGRYFTVVRVAIPAHETEGSPVHLQFTPNTWAYISGIIEENYPEMIVAGWYHSHPRLGVFMSTTDQATQAAFFNHPWNFAVVVDPISRKTGWFAGASCLPMSAECVITYDLTARQGARQAATAEERIYLECSGLGRLSWLLPFFAILALGAVAGAWLLLRERFHL
jgi:proteasome lid subunit RPN8/RPN11